MAATTDADLWAALSAFEKHGSVRAAARATGIPRSTLRDRILMALKRWPDALAPEEPVVESNSEQPPLDCFSERRKALKGEVGSPPIPDIAKPPEGFIIDRNAGTYDAAGNLVTQTISTKRDSGEIYTVPKGLMIKGESAYTDAEGRLIGKWTLAREGSSGTGLIEALHEVFKEFKGRAPVIPPPVESNDDILTVYPLPDLHFGMLSWRKETGDDYDVTIATDLILTSVEELVAQSRPSTKAVILGLGDYFHANDVRAVTPHSGNRLDVDGRWSRVFAAGAKLATHIVEIVARKHQEIEVVMLAGNHDPDAAMSLTVALALFYESNARINVWQDPSIVWYYRFGKCLLGATHGHTMKPDRMAMMMATDRAEDWGQTLYRHMMFGHIHHATTDQIGPVRVESFSSPAARDAYNAGAGFRSPRELSAITYHHNGGEKGRHMVNIVSGKESANAKHN